MVRRLLSRKRARRIAQTQYGTPGEVAEGAPIAEYKVHYEDGSEASIPVEVKAGARIDVELTEGNAFDLGSAFDDAMQVSGQPK